MAEDSRSYQPDTAAANRNNMQGGGVGQRDLDAQQDANRPDGEERSFGDLGEGVPANVDIHKLGQSDRPEQDWGEAAEGATYSQNHTKRADRTEAERGQGAKTRAANKDIVSRRG